MNITIQYQNDSVRPVLLDGVQVAVIHEYKTLIGRKWLIDATDALGRLLPTMPRSISAAMAGSYAELVNECIAFLCRDDVAAAHRHVEAETVLHCAHCGSRVIAETAGRMPAHTMPLANDEGLRDLRFCRT